jgi:hypothetical protein
MSFQLYKIQTARHRFRPKVALSPDKGKETTAYCCNQLKDLTAKQILLIYFLTKSWKAAAENYGLTATNKQQRGHCTAYTKTNAAEQRLIRTFKLKNHKLIGTFKIKIR